MSSVPPLPSQPLPRLFLMPVDSQLHQFLVETHRIVEFEPAILDHIESDLDAYGLKKKLLREADQRFLEGQTSDLPRLKIELHQIDPASLQLEVGRPRIEPYSVYLFLTLGRLFVSGNAGRERARRNHWRHSVRAKMIGTEDMEELSPTLDKKSRMEFP